MSAKPFRNDSGDLQIMAGGNFEFRVRAYDPAGISRVYVQCFPFGLTQGNKSKTAAGDILIPRERYYAEEIITITIHIPDNAALGKWGVQMIEFTNGRGYKTAFYRGQGKFDQVSFEVIPRPIDEEAMLSFHVVEIAASGC